MDSCVGYCFVVRKCFPRMKKRSRIRFPELLGASGIGRWSNICFQNYWVFVENRWMCLKTERNFTIGQLFMFWPKVLVSSVKKKCKNKSFLFLFFRSHSKTVQLFKLASSIWDFIDSNASLSP